MFVNRRVKLDMIEDNAQYFKYTDTKFKFMLLDESYSMGFPLIENKGFRLKDVERDGNCLFRAIEHQLWLNQVIYTHEELRRVSVNYIIENPSQFEGFVVENLDKYLESMSSFGTWADHVVIRALAQAISINIVIYDENLNIHATNPNAQVTAEIFYVGGNHFQSVIEAPNPVISQTPIINENNETELQEHAPSFCEVLYDCSAALLGILTCLNIFKHSIVHPDI